MTKQHSALVGALIALVLAAAGCASSPPGQARPAPASPPPPAAPAVEIARPAADLPGPIGSREPRRVAVDLETKEITGRLADGATYSYWTFGGTVPGPMIRVRQGDTVELRLSNAETSSTTHSIDLHAVTGPGGGAEATQVRPGEEKLITFQALNPGVFVYHCATPHVPTHIAQGMYGLIVVEPPGGLAPVDREFYLMQGEVYTRGERGAQGHLSFDGEKLYREAPDFVVFNGRFQGLTGAASLEARVGERIRLFVGNGGPNLASSFHIIGEILDRVHPEGASEGVSNLQTTAIPPGGAAWVEFTAQVPGRYALVDHAISRAVDKGALAHLEVAGPDNPAVFTAPTAVR